MVIGAGRHRRRAAWPGKVHRIRLQLSPGRGFGDVKKEHGLLKVKAHNVGKDTNNTSVSMNSNFSSTSSHNIDVVPSSIELIAPSLLRTRS